MLTRRPPQSIGANTRMVCGCKRFGIWSCVSCHFHVNLRAFSSYLFFLLRKRMRSPLTETRPGMSPSMPALLKKNANKNQDHKCN